MNSDKLQDKNTAPSDDCGGEQSTADASGLNSSSTTTKVLPSDSACGGGESDVEKDDVPLNKFLDLLNVSCQVNDMITASNVPDGQKKPIEPDPRSAMDLKELAENRLVNDLLSDKLPKQSRNCDKLAEKGECSSSSSSSRDGPRTRQTFSPKIKKKPTEATLPNDKLHPKLDHKLDYVIDEGMLDAVLSFICPVPVPLSYSKGSKAKQGKAMPSAETTNVLPIPEETSEKPADKNVPATKELQKSSMPHLRPKSLLLKKEKREREPEVVIHVCDEVKNTRRDFYCLQRLLVSKMGYFADVTAGQKLEEMDISVHCDIQIFDWLMKWVQYSDAVDHAKLVDAEQVPELDDGNVVPILVSASFLQMEPLMLDCLSFCHAHLTEVVRSSTNVSCLSDAIVTRLAAMFTNLELEMVRDKKERLVPRLWIKLIESLSEPEPEALRGHFYSLAGLFRCTKCNDCVTHTFKTRVNCQPSNMRLNRWGQLVSHHVRDSFWDMSNYVALLFKELKSWRRVYWKLWGHCHYLYCCICEMYFPVYQMSWCRYHPMIPNYLGPVTEACAAGPIGRYPCCDQQAFRYDTLPGPNGCQFREHSVLVECERDRQIMQILQVAIEDFSLCEPPSIKMQEIIKNKDLSEFWIGLSLTPQRCRQGLLPMLNPDESTAKIARRALQSKTTFFADTSSDTDTSDIEVERQGRKLSRNAAVVCDFYSSSDDCESDQSEQRMRYSKKGKKRHSENPGRYWCGDMSARSNQDHQREYEEKVMKQVIALVNKKTGSEQSLAQNIMPAGGSYVRLEAEWKDQLKHRTNLTLTASSSNSCLAKSKNK